MKKLGRKLAIAAAVVIASILALLFGGMAAPAPEQSYPPRPPVCNGVCITCNGACITTDGLPCDPYEPYEVPPECLGEHLVSVPAH